MKTTQRKEIGKALPRPGSIRLGDVLAIPLGDGYWGYVRKTKDASLEILDVINEGQPLVIDQVLNKSILEHVSYCEPWDNPTWVYLGKWKYENEDEAWPAPKYSIDRLNPEIVRIYEKGRSRRTTDKSEIVGMKMDEGLLLPGQLVVKIRSLHGMDSDINKVVEFAPFSSVWKTKES